MKRNVRIFTSKKALTHVDIKIRTDQGAAALQAADLYASSPSDLVATTLSLSLAPGTERYQLALRPGELISGINIATLPINFR